MNAAKLASEASRYLEAIDLFRSLNLEIQWRTEAEEAGAFGAERTIPSEHTCRCNSPRVRINGQHVCFGIE